MIKYLDEENFDDLIQKDLVLVDFYADWCGPCQMMGKVLEELQDISIIKVNTDLFPDLATKYGVMSIPTLIFFKDGAEVKKEIGFKPKEEIETIINDLKK